MYKYDQYDQAIVDARVAEFGDQVRRRLAGDMTEDQFKPLRLMNGLYLQLHAYMLRVAIPYGTLDSRQMRMLAHIARKYDRDYGHFTTRQNIQYNWIKLEDSPIWRQLKCTPSRHRAIASAISRPINMRVRQQMKSLIPGHGQSFCANGPPSTRNSAIYRASSKLR